MTEFAESNTYFSIGRGVMNQTKDTQFYFVTNIGEIARYHDSRIYGHLGMAAIDIVNRGEGLRALRSHENISLSAVDSMVKELRDRHHSSFDTFMTFELGEADVFNAEGRRMLGVEVFDGRDILAQERRVLAQKLSDIANAEVELPPRDMFVNLAYIHEATEEGIEAAVDYANNHAPSSVDVYDVWPSPTEYKEQITRKK